MKRLLLLLLLMGAVGLLCACRGESAPLLAYQEEEHTFVGSCRLADGEYTVEITLLADGSRGLLFLAPDTLAGCRYHRDSAGAYTFHCGDTVLPVAANPTAEAIFGLFALRESELLSADLSETAGTALNVLRFSGGITLYLDSTDGLPLRMEHPQLVLTIHKK